MEEYLLDTNILIYSLGQNRKVNAALAKLKRGYFFVSVISDFEFLVGTKNEKDLKEAEEFLSHTVPLDLRRETVREALKLQRENPGKLQFKDLLIAATAKIEKLTLVTADKDFKSIKGLKVKLVQP